MQVDRKTEPVEELSEAQLRRWCELVIEWGFQTLLSPEDGFTRCSRSRRRAGQPDCTADLGAAACAAAPSGCRTRPA